MPVLEAQLCWNHESREAVCRCLGCHRSFCRECVTEHQGRFLCAVCFAAAVPVKTHRSGAIRKAAPTVLIGAGLLLAWLAYLTFGQSVIGMFRRNAFGSSDTSSLRIPAAAWSAHG